MNVVFLGSSSYSQTVLEAILGESKFRLVAVVTQPNARSGRGQKVTASPIAQAAADAKVPLLQPLDVNDPSILEQLRALEPDVLVTAAYGQKLGKALLGLPKKYALNLHGSLLPKHRGASPVQHAILEGDATTGVTLMKMVSRMDAGPMYAKKEVPILKTDTGETLMARLATAAGELLVEQAEKIAGGKLKGVEQDESAATRASMLEKDDGRIRWDRTAEEIDRHVRAMTPWPSAFTFCPTERSPQRVQVVKGEVLDLPSPGMPGTVVAFTSGIEVATAKGVYRLLQVKRSGKRALDAVEFLRGSPIPVGTRLQ